jgi:hypothetical protein
VASRWSGTAKRSRRQGRRCDLQLRMRTADIGRAQKRSESRIPTRRAHAIRLGSQSEREAEPGGEVCAIEGCCAGSRMQCAGGAAVIGSRRQYASADRAAEVYFRLVVELDLPSSAQGQGGSVCALCRTGLCTLVPGKNGMREVCSDCRKVWTPLDLTAAVRAPRSSKMKKLSSKRPPRRPGDARCMVRLDDLIPLREIFEPRPREMTRIDWSFHRLILSAQCYKRLSVREIVDEGPLILPRVPRGWTEHTVRGGLERVTRIIEDRLHRAGMWGGERLARWAEEGGRGWRRAKG